MRRRVLSLLAIVVGTPLGLLAQQAPPPPPDLAWLADGRRFQVGDIITVVVDEYTSASADRSTSAVQDRTADAGGAFSVNGQGTDGDLGTFLGSQSSREGRDIRRDRIASEVSVRVTALEPNGALSIEGTKMLVIDDHEQQVTVRGVIRPQDISALNTVESWRVAGAEVLYATDGNLGQAEKSMLMRLLGWIL